MLHRHRMARGILMGRMTPVWKIETHSVAVQRVARVMPRQAGPDILEGLRQTCTSLQVSIAIRFIAAMMTVAFPIIPLIEARWSVRCISTETLFSRSVGCKSTTRLCLIQERKEGERSPGAYHVCFHAFLPS